MKKKKKPALRPGDLPEQDVDAGLSPELRVRRKPFTWRMFLLILGVMFVLSASNVAMLEVMLKTQVFPLIISMGVGSYWALMAFIAAFVIHRVSCIKFDKPMRRLSNAMRKVAQGDFSVRLEPLHRSPKKYDYMDIMLCDFNRMVQELGSSETMKDDFIANVSHELKTPLAVIGSYAQALDDPTISEEQRREYARTIRQATRNLSSLISNILRLNKLEHQELIPQATVYDLTRQLSDCALAREESWETKGIDFDAALEERILIAADESMLEIVFNNLIDNAIKFTPAGGSIRLSLERAGENAVIRITDTGCGMSPETVAHIFDKFYQGDTSHSQEGNGLGLALVRRVLEISGGTITVDSRLGEGTEFTVMVPCIEEN